jgi:hypothetical protein
MIRSERPPLRGGGALTREGYCPAWHISHWQWEGGPELFCAWRRGPGISFQVCHCFDHELSSFADHCVTRCDVIKAKVNV